MKYLSIMAISLAFTLASAQVSSAQNAAAGSIATSNTQSGAQAGAVLYLDQSTPGTQTVNRTGTSRIETAPSLGGLALGGGHPCAYSPATGQVSLIGGGGGFGGMKVDSACLLMIVGAAGNPQAQQAAIYMIAGRDDDACKAMYKAGMIADCVNSKGRSTVKAKPVVATRSAPVADKKMWNKCSYNKATNEVNFRKTSGVSSKAGGAACYASLGF
jgi:hypothetical protein